ncbi:MAG TPA: hypothetical protein VLG44_04905 [Chlamydiales bacterium]|nr:hypothetical protein [Chlamydiales bacterium]
MRLFSRPRKIEVFARYCLYSSISHKKERHSFFSRENCYRNLLATTKEEKNIEITFFLDTFHGDGNDHFLQNAPYPVIKIKEGSEAGSFLKMLEHVEKKKLAPDTLIYFLEDDYIHRPGWAKILREGIDLNLAGYITLYDHQDKYHPEYKDLSSQILLSPSTHWRTTPSTTNTFAMLFSTLQSHLDVHREFSINRKISEDHKKFLALGQKGALLLSPIPGWSTHMEPRYESPCIDWEKVLSNTL